MMKERKARARLEAAFGEAPDITYYPGDMERVAATYQMRREKDDGFSVDDDTWRALDMDRVFRRINAAHSTSGEQHLYYQLRCPAMNAAEYGRREKLLRVVEDQPALRLDAQQVLFSLGRWRSLRLRDAFSPPKHGNGWFLLTLALALAFLGSAVGAVFSPLFYGPLAVLALANPFYHLWQTRRLEGDLLTISYSVALVTAAKRLRKRKTEELQKQLPALWEASDACGHISGLGFASFAANADIMTLFNGLLHLDLLAYERLKRKLGGVRAEIETLHMELGRLDAAISTASFRRSLAQYCDPDIDFSPQVPSTLCMAGLIHPLLEHPAPNDINTRQPVLLTGANASGKSTFLKASALSILLAQSLCTALCSDYAAPAFSLYASMAITDDVESGDSYFVAELKSQQRIFAAVERGERVFCVVDEVLRGTNTLERIAASSALLETLADKGAFCFAATHDGELCGLLAERWRLCHFEEQVEGRVVRFDYRLREGPATSSNAILLMEGMGFAPEMVKLARSRASYYREHGRWADA